LAEEPAAGLSPSIWGIGVGYSPEYFHWHETSSYEWWQKNDPSKTLEGATYRFLTEDGYRHRFHVDLECQPNPKIRLDARVTYLAAAVNYDGGLQPATAAAASNWLRDSQVVDGQTYYKYAKKPLTSVTGYSGWQFDGIARAAIPLQAKLFLDASLGWSYRSVKRMLNYDGTGSGASGYDETWKLSWTEIGVGPGVRSRSWKASLRGFCLFPLSTSQDIDMTTNQVTLFPVANVGWRTELDVEWALGLRLGLSYEQRDFSESPAVGGYSQPASVERVGRLDASWFF
jgi:hypothetical protein